MRIPLQRLLPLSLLVLTMACGDGPSMGELGPNPGRFMEPPPPVASWTLLAQAEADESVRTTMAHEGSVEIAGRTFTRMRGATDAQPDEIIEATLRYDGDHFEMAEVSASDVVGFGAVALRGPPVRARMNPPVGEPQAIEADGWEFEVGGVPSNVTVTGTYTLLNPEATVDTPQGQFGGCRHYRIEGSAGRVAGLPIELEATGEIWVKTGIGVVAGWFEIPLVEGGARRTLHLEDFQGGGPVGGGRAIARRDGVVSPQDPFLRNSSFDINRDFDADKNTHAKMLVELRWADPARARSDERPPIDVEFTTIFGRFPHPGLFPLEASILNPHENGHGYRFWYAFVDQAAKNQPDNGIAYGTEVRWLESEGAAPGEVRVSSMVNYKLYRP